MASCRTVEFLYRAVPLRVFRDHLIRNHLETCAHCRAGLVSQEEARRLFVRAEDAGSVEVLWGRIADQAVRRASAPARPAAGLVPGLRWATAAAMALVIAVTGFWLLDQVSKIGPEEGRAAGNANFRLDYVNIGGAPAQTFVFQPIGSDTVFVWAQRVP